MSDRTREPDAANGLRAWVARLMGGDIRAESAGPGQGSRFMIALPLQASDPVLEAPVVVPEAGGRRLAGLTLLSAEDVEVNRLILEDLLQHEGARVVSVENGREAVERLSALGVSSVDLVLMDVQMPEMDGYEATRRLHDLAPELPVIGVTAHALPEEREKCRAAGMVEHLTKPIDVEALVAAIRRHVRHAPEIASAGHEVPVGSNASIEEPRPSAVAGLVDWAALEQRFRGRADFVARLVRVALEANAAMPERLTALVESGDLDGLAATAHSIKGASANLEARSVSELAREVEQTAKVGDPRALELAVDLIERIERLSGELEVHSAAS